MNNNIGPLTNYLVKTLLANGFIVIKVIYIKEDKKGLDFYLVRAVKFDDLKHPSEYYLVLEEHKHKHLAKDKHQMDLHFICRFSSKEESDFFLEEVKTLNYPKEDYVQGNLSAGKLANAVCFKKRLIIKDIRNFKNELKEAEEYLINKEIIHTYRRSFDYQKNKA